MRSRSRENPATAHGELGEHGGHGGRVGNAVLYSTSYFQGAGDPAVVEAEQEREQDRSAEVVAQMCVFAADPC